MHAEVMNHVRGWVKEYQLNRQDITVLELGAQNYNGTVRGFFSETDYLATDMLEGDGVDLVVDAHDLLSTAEFWPESDVSCEDIEYVTEYCKDQGYCDCGDNRVFDVVICLEMLEHDLEFWRTMRNISYVLKPGGYLILSARGATEGQPGTNGESMWEHGYPHDYWRFMPQAVKPLHDMAECKLLTHIRDRQHPGFISIGRKT